MFVTRGHWGLEVGVMMVATANGRGFRGIWFILTWKYNIVNKSLHIDIILFCHCFNYNTFMFTKKFNITVPDSLLHSTRDPSGESGRDCEAQYNTNGPHQHERKFSSACVCRVTFKHLPQPLRSHIASQSRPDSPLGSLVE